MAWKIFRSLRKSEITLSSNMSSTTALLLLLSLLLWLSLCVCMSSASQRCVNLEFEWKWRERSSNKRRRTCDDDDEIVSDSVNGFVVSTPEIVFSALQKINYRNVCENNSHEYLISLKVLHVLLYYFFIFWRVEKFC
jgi:hypothetical protein